MANRKGISYYKDWIYIILFAITIFGFVAKAALLTDQVGRNTEILTKYNLELIDYKLEQLLNLIDE